jgi:hypothetical protein
MRWKLSRPNVELRVTRFLPEIAPASAGLTEEQREALKAKRQAEQKKVRPLPQWRIDELREKYAAADAYEPNEVDE